MFPRKSPKKRKCPPHIPKTWGLTALYEHIMDFPFAGRFDTAIETNTMESISMIGKRMRNTEY